MLFLGYRTLNYVTMPYSVVRECCILHFDNTIKLYKLPEVLYL